MPLRTRFYFGFVATIIICLFYLNISYSIGHLSHDMTWDDISYALSAVERLDTLIRSGLYDFLMSWTNPYPHSVYSELAAMVSLLLFGINDFGFYVFNFSIILAIFIFLHYNFRNSDNLTFSLIFIFIMFSTISYSIVDNFRPDFVLGLATTGLVWWTLKGIFFGRERDFLWGGLALALALLIKPTFFAHTIAVATGLLILAIISKIIQKKGHTEPEKNPLLAVKYISIGIIIASPYYVLAGREVFEYFWTNTQGENSAIWSFSDGTSMTEVISSYVFGGYLNNGGMQVPAAGLISLMLLPVLYYYKKYRELIIVSLLLIVALSSFGVMVFGRHKSQFFFATFHMLIMLSSIYAIASVSEKTSRIGRFGLLSTFAFIIFFTTAQNHRYLFIDTGQDSLKTVSENKVIVDQIIRTLAQAGRASDIHKKPASVFVPVAGPVSLPTIKWEARKAGFFINGRDVYLSNDISEYLDLARQADFVVLPYRIEAEYNKNFPSGQIQASLAQILMQDTEFRPLAPPTPGSRYIVLERTYEKQDSVFNINFPGTMHGFAQEEGPYPQWQLPRVAWMSTRKAQVCLYKSGNYLLEMEAKSPLEANVLLSTSTGIRLMETKFRPDQFQTVSIRHDISPEDPCIVIEYDASVPPSGEQNYLLFSHLKITKTRE